MKLNGWNNNICEISAAKYGPFMAELFIQTEEQQIGISWNGTKQGACRLFQQAGVFLSELTLPTGTGQCSLWSSRMSEVVACTPQPLQPANQQGSLACCG